MAKITQVLVQQKDGDYASEEDYVARVAFSVKGYPVGFFTWEDLKARRCTLSRETLLVGGPRSVHEALRQIGLTPPPVLNLPERLERYRGRRVWTTDWGTIHREFLQGRTEPLFVEPL